MSGQDLDIDALLAQSNSDTTLQGQEHGVKTSLVQKLRKAWINERYSPELCEYPEDTIKDLLAQLDIQREKIEELESNAERFSSVVLQTELERINFLMRSLLRTRISKVLLNICH